MKIFFALLFLVTCALICKSQNDTSKIYNSNLLKKGFYKNYQEYLDNAPSVTPAFTSILQFIKDGKDSIVTGARYSTSNGTAITGAWGFCNGTDVFIGKRISIFKKRFLKAQYIGRNPFFISWHKDIYVLGEQATDTTAGTAPARYDLMFINPEGKVKKASYSNLKNLFAATPDLLRKFTTERAFTNKIKTEYLVLFNEKFIE